jgi:radical SAM superfamily enzyme YgiQ (UPF0313 family)
MVEMAGEAFLYVRTAVIYEDIIHIAVGIGVRRGCGGGCEGCSVTSWGQVNVCHWIQNNKEADPRCFAEIGNIVYQQKNYINLVIYVL